MKSPRVYKMRALLSFPWLTISLEHFGITVTPPPKHQQLYMHDSEKNQLNLSSIVWGTLLYTVQVDLTMSTSRVIQNQTLIGNLQEIHNSSIGWFQSKLIDSTTKFIYIYNVKSKQPQPFFVYFAFLFGIVCIVWIGSIVALFIGYSK
eukprot:618439_1